MDRILNFLLILSPLRMYFPSIYLLGEVMTRIEPQSGEIESRLQDV
jgi:hypothetical protein